MILKVFMTNLEIAKLLRNVAASYTIKDEKKYRFQIIAYQNAADSIEHSITELKDLQRENRLNELAGVGSTIKEYLAELLKEGKVNHFSSILKGVPESVFPLLDIPSFGPKKAYKLILAFKLKNPETVIKDIENLSKKGKVANIEGFGEKSEKDILRAITEYKIGKNKTVRMVLPYAIEQAQKIIEYMEKSKDVIEVSTLGSLRRMVSTIGDIDIAVSTNNPKKVIEYFISYPAKERIVEKGGTTASILVSGGKQIDLMTQPPESFGSLLQHLTGSKAHNVHLREYALKKGFSLSEYGIKRKIENEKWKMENYSEEKSFYNAIGLEWIPPEIRENTGEIELAVSHKLPKLIELKDIKGDLHLHSNFPIEPSHDLGTDTFEAMIEKARELGYKYLGFSEHNPSVSKHTPFQIYDIIAKRNERIEQINLSIKDIRIINLLEVDILANGNLALNDKTLDKLDAVIVSIHSGFSMNKELMTKRILAGLSHPKAKILAHPTGRKINERKGYDVDFNKIFDFCKENNKALEINSFPSRLDLPDTQVRQAVDLGIKMIINTDSHTAWQMTNMRYGISVARRGWAKKDDILNSLDYNELIAWIQKK